MKYKILYVIFVLYLIQDCTSQQNEEVLCDKPNEYRDGLQNCVSDTFLFPSSKATCDYCGRVVQIQCEMKNDKTGWFRTDGVTNFNPCPENGIPPSTTMCNRLQDIGMICKNMSTNVRYYVGHRTVCTCVNSCQDVVIECQENGFWYHKDICSMRTEYKKDGTLNSHFVKSRSPGEPSLYTFECDSGYEIINGSSHVTCSNGILNGSKPRCQKIELAMCDMPFENINGLQNCVSDSFLFPANRATCDFCGNITHIVCRKKSDMQNEWIGIEKNIKDNCNPPQSIPKSSITCSGSVNDSKIKCKNSNPESKYYLNDRIRCTCIDSCQDVVLECKRDAHGGYWYHNLNKYTEDICNIDGNVSREGMLLSHYIKPLQNNKDAEYIFECGSGYELTNGDSKFVCKNGELTGSKPICKKIDGKNTVKKHVCPSLINSTLYTCSEFAKNFDISATYWVGRNVSCTCNTNCRNFTIECQSDGNWISDHLRFNNRDPCEADSMPTVENGIKTFYNATGKIVYNCNNENESKFISCVGGVWKEEHSICKLQDTTNESEKIIKTEEHMNDEMAETMITIILSSIIITLFIIIITMISYLIYIKRKRQLIRPVVQNVVIEEQNYDYPVFNNVDEHEYAYPTFPLNNLEPNTAETQDYEYIAVNEIYESAEGNNATQNKTEE